MSNMECGGLTPFSIRRRSGVKPPLSIVRLVILFILITCAPSWAAPEYRGITILHTNDTHGHLIPFSFAKPIDPKEGSASMPYLKDIGGIARRATLVKRIEAECRGNVLLFDAGDPLDGTPFSIEYMGEADFAAMSAAGYDAMTPGNHEFSASYDEFYRNVHTATFPVLSANIIDRKTGKLALPQYTIFTVDDVRIAVFGLTVPATNYRGAKEGFDFIDPIEAAKELVPQLRQKADVVVALTHISDSGTVEDERLAREAPGIDVIVAGHAHVRLAKPLFVRTTEQREAFKLGGTIVVEDYWFGGELGRLDLRLRRDGGPFTVMGYDGGLIPITSDTPDDPATKKVVDRYYKPISKKYDEVIGKASGTFYAPPSRELLALVCEAMRDTAGAQFGIYNPGGVRGDLVEGEIKVWDIAVVLPFKNKLLTAEITGRQLKQAVEEHELGISGDVKTIEDDTVYTIATVDFLIGGPLKDAKPIKTVADDYRDAVIGYIKKQGTISPM